MNFDTKLFLDALTMPVMLQGAAIAILLSILVQVASFLLCLPLAVALNSMAAVRRTAAQLYVWLFRSSPLILVLLIVWNGAPQPGLTRAPWYTPFAAAFIAFTLVTTAYMAEAMRGALAAIGQGQTDAARALGLNRLQTFGLVVLPQALRIVMPVLVNEFINLIKLTSLAYVISMREIMAVVNDAIASSFRFVEWYSAALVYYLAIVSILMFLQRLIQRRMA
ncbi:MULTISPECIES: amino acid ABC transporter permease [unclassified Ensifer]|uniref:amino acid ABC transporter permease n=1 Tax=unclassified Ensifer TaxID=2633371 RepID=UPI00070F6ECD|nr:MULTISPECIES: amino acid ABC transporter permease [unclassified Ensifer]KQW58334.1 hypothetical protein ASD02_04755 [Ensifer sp. Root1252]KRC67168.1 hypothetical protein ASE32_08215 [Ensifer sp. Root231]KRC98244.1 hypothetical protein ASE47_03405 [Ensifer sp. Root258]